MNADAQCKTTGDLCISLHHRCSKLLIRANAILHHNANLINITDSLSVSHCLSLRSPRVTPSTAVHCVFAQCDTLITGTHDWQPDKHGVERRDETTNKSAVTASRLWLRAFGVTAKTSPWDIIWMYSERCYQKASFSGRIFESLCNDQCWQGKLERCDWTFSKAYQSQCANTVFIIEASIYSETHNDQISDFIITRYWDAENVFNWDTCLNSCWSWRPHCQCSGEMGVKASLCDYFQHIPGLDNIPNNC